MYQPVIYVLDKHIVTTELTMWQQKSQDKKISALLYNKNNINTVEYNSQNTV